MSKPVLLLLWFSVAFCAAVSAAPQRQQPTANVPALCQQFLAVSKYVVANCSSPQFDALDANCLESFESFAESPSLLIACEKRERDAVAKQHMVQFMELYNRWQKHHLCEVFHAKEQRAARRCGGAAVQKPWHGEDFPLFCEQIFKLYRANRAALDATCARTEFSDTFWEAYADYVASPLCKTYYQHVRDATAFGCQSDATDRCEHMFQWYTQHRESVERDCLEVQSAKPFYKGFYAWKHQKGK